MAKYIKLEPIYNQVLCYLNENAYLNDTPQSVLEKVLTWLQEAQTIEIVHCKECARWAEPWPNSNVFGNCTLLSGGGMTRPDHHCPQGVLRGES